MDLSPIESPTSSGLSSPHEAYVPPTKLRVDSVPDPKPSEPPSLSLDTYLPLGSINIKLADPKNAIEAISWVEAEDFLPFTNISQTFNLSLAALWRAQWIRVLRLPLAEQYEEAWRIYVLPDVCELVHERARALMPYRMKLDRSLTGAKAPYASILRRSLHCWTFRHVHGDHLHDSTHIKGSIDGQLLTSPRCTTFSIPYLHLTQPLKESLTDTHEPLWKGCWTRPHHQPDF